MSFEARVHDRHVPWYARAPRYALLALLFVLGLYSPVRVQLPFLLATLGAALLAHLASPRRGPRVARVSLSPGVVELHDAHGTSRLRALDLVGASASARDGRTALALMPKSRTSAPVVLELTLAQANDVRAALGVPSGGMGYVAWALAPSPFARWMYAARIVTGIALVALAVSPLGTPLRWLAHPLATFAAQITVLAVVVAMSLKRSFSRVLSVVALDATHVSHRTADGGFQALAYSGILDATVDAGKIVVTLAENRAPLEIATGAYHRGAFGLTDADAQMVAAQIRDASQRARGAVAPRTDVGDRLDTLRRRGEPTRAWLARLDATAASLSGADAYRGGAIDQADLWQALGSADADVELRQASARVLMRIAPDTARTRIAEALATLHETRDVERIRVSLGADVDAAASELDDLAEREAYAQRMER